MAGSHKLMDATVPRPSPRFPLLPTPFNYEKPVAQVPDISLIFDSAASSPVRPSSTTNSPAPTVSTNTTNTNDNTTSSTSKQPNSFEVHVLYDMMKKQEETISKMSSQITFIMDYQATQFNNFQTMLTKLTECLPVKVKTTDQSVQTDRDNNVVVTPKPTHKEHRVTIPSTAAIVQTEKNANKIPNIERSRSSSGSSSASSSSNNNDKDPQSVSPFTASKRRKPLTQSSESMNDNRMEDLSTILKDLQLPTIQETSIFSEASIHPIDLQDYNDSMDESDSENHRIGPSVSKQSSSSDEETVQPTATFYRNVIGNVNRMLENNQETTIYGSSDTTVYGMSSNNLSFATKQYLQKYGLVKPKKLREKQNANPETNRQFQNEESPPDNNRVLDLTALRNQPKLL